MPEPNTTGETKETTLAFLSIELFDDERTFRGAALITDGETKPLEFRCTAPLRPSALQRLLYGSSLLPTASIDLIGLPLVKAIQSEPDLYIVQDRALLELRPHVEKPVVLLERGEVLTSESQEEEEPVRMGSSSGKFDSVVVSCYRGYENEREACSKSLEEIFARVDLMEPFQRISTALAEVQREEGKRKKRSAR